MSAPSSQSQWSIVNMIKSEKLKALANSLNASFTVFKDVVEEHIKFETDLDNYKSQVEKLNSQSCKKCEESQRLIADKDSLIQSIASTVTRLNSTRDFNLINELCLLINGATCSQGSKNSSNDSSRTNESVISDDSSSEIEATPTGRISPILRSRIRTKSLIKRKKSNEHISTDVKMLKLTQSTPNTTPKANARMKQLRLKLTKVKPSKIVDITTLPEIRSQSDKETLQVNIKKESLENDDTILPSPTSVANKQEFLHISKSFEEHSSPGNFRKPSKLMRKKDLERRTSIEKEPIQEESLNLLLPMNNRCDRSPINTVRDPDETFFDSLDYGKDKSNIEKSPMKSPLIENVNVSNTSIDNQDESMSLLAREGAVSAVKIDEPPKIAKKENYVPVYREETVRKKAEKLALPGWSCDKCKNFYEVIYKDNPAMLLKLMTECSKHRGRQNPIRPPTPPGYWNPRWNVATDTEQFNRENNAL